ncbi:glutamate receptor U1-like [Trichogramma pretiosum]|uniref:glutamate receptor U1-like n=1 Tax=Trichogramma pretiosum TaxID=7493 RepID=UPI000C7198E3|nr:glutamate receptor U1-like [Trichogramma pretiosum]
MSSSSLTSARRVNFQGKELQVATYFNPPLCYLKSTTKRTINGIEADVFLADSKRELDGIELQLFLILAEALNFTYVLRKPRGRYNHGRKFNDTDWNGGMIGQLYYGEVDLAFGGIWISLDNNEFVALSEPWSQTRIHFLVPRPRSYSNVWALARPLSPSVWLLLALALLLESVYLRGRALRDPRVPRRYRHLAVSLAESLGRLLGSATARVPPPLRLQFVLWQLVAVVLIACYNSSLSARLTNPDFERRIDTVKQFIDANLSWGRESTPPQFEEYFNLEDEYAKQLPSRFVLEDSVHNRTQRLLQGNYAVIGKVIGDVYYPENFVTAVALQRLRVMREILGQFYLCFALRPRLLRPVNEIMMRLTESGIVLYHMGNVIHRRTGSKLREVFVEYDNIDYDRAVVLTINPLSAAFFILLIGLTMASLVFYAEIGYGRRKRWGMNERKK